MEGSQIEAMEKVLIITTVSGFLQQFELNDVRILKALGYEVHYASNFENSVYETDSGLLSELGVILHPISIRKSPCAFADNLKALRKLCEIIKKERISVIHCHNPVGGVLGRLAPLFCKDITPYVLYTAHGFHFYRGAPLLNWLLFFPAEAMLSHLTDCLITINEEDYQRALRMRLKKGGSAVRIPGVGIPDRKFADMEGRREELRRKNGIPKECFYILTAGELNQNKNQQVLLRAVALLGQKKVHLGICGEGLYREHLKQMAEALGITKQVSFLGYRSDLQELLAAADVFVFPSIREGFAVAPLEALAAGIPLITSDRRDSREYIKHGENGFLCRENTPKEYVEAIRILMEQEGLRIRLSKEGKKTARQYALPKTAHIMEEIYGNMPKGRERKESM